jgi:glucose-6-phosphate 1-dehydrogenase
MTSSLPHSPFVMVIFGATGDLAKSKLVPALFSLYKQQQLPKDFYIFGFARRDLTDQEFVDTFSKNVKDPLWEDFSKHMFYQQGTFGDDAGYNALIEKLEAIDDEIGACITRLFYLATPPDHYQAILGKLQETKLSEGCGQGSNKWTRIIIEKPFGKDLDTARELDRRLAEIFEEKQIFRVDHYLAKDVVQNLIAFRFANGIFEPVWNNKRIDHVQITMSETSGVELRGKFFDGVGNLRDVAQNHLLQLFAAITMEQPRSFTKEGVRDARADAISAIECIDQAKLSEQVVRAQYDGYRDIKNVDPQSETETFVAMKFFVNTDRFRGVPFYLRAGKKMKKDAVEVSLVFIQTCHILFKEYGCPEVGNVLTIRLDPDEGISLRVIAKKPGAKVDLGIVDMKFTYKDEFGTTGTDAYEKLLLDIFNGDQMLFNRSDELESSWEFISQILKGWEEKKAPLLYYEPGSDGPHEADHLIERDGRKWL